MSSAAGVPGDAKTRLFLALRLPDHTVERLVAWQRELPDGAFRLVPPENLHVTLAFLGARPEAEIPAICGALREAAAAARRPSLRVARYRETRSVGMLTFDDEGGRAASLAGDLAGRLERLGVYRAEARRWLAHVTVVRFRVPPRLAAPPPDLGEVSPSDAAVYSSVLRSDGAQYAVLKSVALGG
ncbi:MAG: RNA 2',3'-cyclic phosphodiesterase [Gaiellaceae bacterium]